MPYICFSFARSLVENRLKEFGKLEKTKLITLEKSKTINYSHFNLDFIDTTHSIPETAAILIKTKYGNLLHTADWKIDRDPILGENFDTKDSFIELSAIKVY